MKSTGIIYGSLILLLRAGLIGALFATGWFVYSELPRKPAAAAEAPKADTALQIVLRQSAGIEAGALDIPIELYPVDLVAARHEYFSERRAGKRFDDFLIERMKGRKTITAKLDKQGQATVVVSAGNWWVHAQLAGDEELEWRVPISVGGGKQTVELTSQNVYTRARSF